MGVRAEDKKPDLGGTFWVNALHQVFFSLLLFVFVSVGILFYNVPGPGRRPGIFAATSAFALLKFWRDFKSLQWKHLPFETVAELDEMTDFTPSSALEYEQPELSEDVDPDFLSKVMQNW